MRKLDERGARMALAMFAALALAACSQSEDKAYEADVVDESGGELIVTQPDPDAVPVDLPETEMTNVPVPEGEEVPAGD